MSKWRKKPVIVDAIQYTGDNAFDCVKFAGEAGTQEANGDLTIITLEGRMHVSRWDWVMKGVKGEFYPIKPDILELTYEKVEDDK
jgi:hypothetical protein